MTPEERFDRIETTLEKHNDAIRGLIVVSRTCLDSIQGLSDTVNGLGDTVNGLGDTVKGLRDTVKELHDSIKELRETQREAQRETDEKLNILIATVDRIIRQRNGKE